MDAGDDIWLCTQMFFNEKYRQILKRRLLDGVTYDKLSEEFDMSVRQVKRIVYKAEDRLFHHK